MKPLRIAINGYGRIGRCLVRALFESGPRQLQLVAINEPAELKTIAHLTRYDSTFGRFSKPVDEVEDGLLIDGELVRVCGETNVSKLPWGELDIDVVLECSGTFSSRREAEQHLQAGAKRLIFSHPAESEDDVDATIVYGINHRELSGEERILSTGSCTTNCVVPVLDVLRHHLDIEAGMLNTIHSAMNDQPVIDAYHHTDLRKTRSAIQSIIPVDTGLARGIGRFFPCLLGRLESTAIRVPTVNVSAVNLTLTVAQHTDAATVNALIEQAAVQAGAVLGITEEPLASCDFLRDPRSGIVDAGQTRVANGHLVKLLVWFDNEWAYSNRMLDVCEHIQTLDDDIARALVNN
ncbi:D-erythrose 4-phosphate dehydrogenase [Sinobacterium caligoides]|uniref:D-erythrose 4-phosphate dehydrogenase n=1 Tax=Sinobacterium caligoides TaxID=933926 RepID=A0A3N2DGJ3_9GAMM|nr:glyceraldehyde 3-phosphate dehydrogenase NAD-binding domain-containing protein [Sinobacterium caligoides]ROR98907.1 D-erythrose 4-phosphate dehydrogenase [Sinobacterium caligoides]